ncbi:MAG: Adenosine deaminase, partial [Actinomycetota bacterium]
MSRVSLGELAEWVRDRGIALEVCPTSNLQT